MANHAAGQNNRAIIVQIASTAFLTLASAFLSVGYGAIPPSLALLQELQATADQERASLISDIVSTQTELMKMFLAFGYGFLIAGAGILATLIRRR